VPTSPIESTVTLWSSRFRTAEIAFTDEVEAPIDDAHDVGAVHGQNAFLKIYLDDLIIDLIVYI